MNYITTVEYLISLGSSGLVELINNASPYIKAQMLRVLVVHADHSLVSRVFAEIKPTEDILYGVANNIDLVCMPDKFLHFLGTITDKEAQEKAPKNGLGALILANNTECLDTLIFALENETSLSVDLMNVAIHHAVLNASHSRDGSMLCPKLFFDHPAVSVDDYSNALYHFYQSKDPKNELFYWLLARADRQDLERVKKECWFLSRPSEFQDAVNHAFNTVGTEVRIGKKRRERVTAMREALGEYVSKVLIDLTSEFIEW